MFALDENGRFLASLPGKGGIEVKGIVTLGLLLVGLTCSARALAFGGAADITAVSSRASPDYRRARQPDGTYSPEAYVFGNGGTWAGVMKDESIDKLSFLDVAHVIAGPLAVRHYYPATDPAKTKLLIMLYWGTTHAPEHANESNGMALMEQAEETVVMDSKLYLANTTQGGVVGMEPGWSPISTARVGNSPEYDIALDELAAAVSMVKAENHRRERDDIVNIRMLGYDSWAERTGGDKRGTAFEQSRRDLYDEIEHNRYFVVLMAYDFRLLSKEKKHRLLWETRFSIAQEHHLFDKELPALAKYASRYFGEDSGGLVHERIPPGKVEVGPLNSLGEASPQK